MSKNINGVIPKWRFESFDSYPKWDIKKLGCLMEPINERVGDKKYVLMSVTSGVGLIPQVEKFGKEIAGNSYKNYYVIRKNDFAYNKSSTKEFPEGYISMLKEYEEAAIPNSIFTCFRVINDEYEPIFFEQLFNTNYHGKWLRKYIEIGARAHGALSIDTKHLWNMPVAVPKLPEQQKISDCLSSIDDLISVEEKKLSLLSDYKKGWMQKLFPAEGKTVPEWRFPEFKDDNNWKCVEIETVGKVITGKTPPTSNDSLWNGSIQFVTPTDIVGDKYQRLVQRTVVKTSNMKVLPKGTIMFTCIASVGKMAISVYPCVTNQQINSIITKKGYYNEFIYYSLFRNVNKIKSGLSNTTVPIINKTDFSKIQISVTLNEKEQQKIANFLSGIDDLISTQTDRIEALKQHKKALMQGLFPAVEEVWK